MQVFSVDKNNIDDFGFLFNDDAVMGIKAEVNDGFVIKKDDRHVGGLYGEFTAPNEFTIISIYVLPEFRRQGVGSFMLQTLYDVIDAASVSVTAHFVAIGEDGKAMAEFFESSEYDDFLDAENTIYYTKIEKLKDIKLKASSKKIRYVPFAEIPAYSIKELVKAAKGYVPVPEGGVEAPSVLKELSFGMYDGEKLCGYAICEAVNDDNVMLSCLYVKKGVTPIALTGLLGTLASTVQEWYPNNSGLIIPCINDDSRRLVETLFAEEDIEEVSANYTKRITKPTNLMDVPLSEFLADERLYLYGESEEGAYLTEGEPMV